MRRWKRTLPQALNEYELPMRRLGGFLDGDVQHALALLDDKIETFASLRGAGGARRSDAPGADAARLRPAPRRKP